MNTKMLRRIAIACLCSVALASLAWADSLELRNGQLIQGKYLGGTVAVINFSVNGKVQQYPITNVLMLTFGPDTSAQTTTSDQTAQPPPSTATATSAKTVTVPSGREITVRMIDSVDSKTNQIGDRFRASLDQDLIVGDTVVASKGTEVYGRLVQAEQAGHLGGSAQLRLELTGILINGQVYPLVTGDYQLSGASRGKNTAEKVGGGAALGAIIGAIAGGGKGAAIGAGVGAGAGTVAQVMTRGQQVHVPSETVLQFMLRQPATLPIANVPGQ